MQTLSINEQEFILAALSSESRMDGRKLMESRNIKVIFGSNVGEIEVLVGETHVITKTTAEITQPKIEKPNEGFLKFAVDLSQLNEEQQPKTTNLRKLSNEIQKLLEKIIKGSKAIDMESLCVVTAKKVWSVNVETSVVSNGGNLIDVIYLAVITSLLHFRKPFVSVEQQSTIKVHTDRNPQPLSIHHIPIPFTFAFFQDATIIVADPLAIEEDVMEGRVTISVNVYNDVCNIHKPGGAPVKLELVDKLIEACLLKIRSMTEFIRDVLKNCSQHSIEEIRKQNQVIILDCKNISASAQQQQSQMEVEVDEQKTKVNRNEIQSMLDERNQQ